MLACTGAEPVTFPLSSCKNDAKDTLLQKEGVSFPDENLHASEMLPHISVFLLQKDPTY